MKKIYTLILTLILSFSLTACSNTDKGVILDFFKSFNSTLTADSGRFTGDISIKSDSLSNFGFDIYLNQKQDVQLACKLNLKADDHVQDDFLNFYIRDGKTYLNMMGVTSQSKAENINLNPGDKISVYNPFLNFTDEEIVKFFESAKKKGDTYILKLDTNKLGVLLDSMGSVSVFEAVIEAEEKDGSLISFDLHVKMSQNIKEEHKTDFTIHVNAENLNHLNEVPFPDDLETY